MRAWLDVSAHKFDPHTLRVLNQASDYPYSTPPNSEGHQGNFYRTENYIKRDSSTLSTEGKFTICYLPFAQQQKIFLLLLIFTRRKTEFTNNQVILF